MSYSETVWALIERDGQIVVTVPMWAKDGEALMRVFRTRKAARRYLSDCRRTYPENWPGVNVAKVKWEVVR